RVSANTVVENPQVAALVERYEEDRRLYIVREQKKREQAALLQRKAGNLYLGSSWCGSCHGEIEKAWLKSRHAEAISSLSAKGRDNDPACLACHVTGLNDNHAVGGFISMENNPKMSGVQCEVCHGPGGRHASFPGQVKMRSVKEETCRSCHNHDTDPTFDFKRSLNIIDHGKMPQGRK
ncbi:MAG: cytochrome c family protein, partial [Pseudomonadota bacterium]|nr:cytochrome c family protein [Pseudomonadota bacterium]